MNKVLPTSLRSLLSLIAVFVFTVVFQARVSAQANLLTNGSFEVPAMSIFNLNNIIGVGQNWGGWNCTNGGFNILRMLGSGYNSGANHASDGNQYVDVAGTDGWISQAFELTNASPVSFSGDFSSREAGWSNYVNWTARVEIIDSTGSVVAASPTRNFVTADNMENWYTLTGSSSTLQPGHYTYRAYAGNSGHFDNAVVTALSGQVLAVKLIDFKTVSKNNQLISSWTVSYEENVNGYELEGSKDGSNFSKIRFIAAKNSGTYSIVNRRPANHTDYYRLKVINGTGVPTYSKVITLKDDNNSGMAIYPNPAATKFSINLDANLVNESGTLSLLNSGGQVVKEQKFAKLNTTENVDISALSPGTYFVRVAAGSNVMTKQVQVMPL